MARKHDVPSGNRSTPPFPHPHSVAILETDALHESARGQPFAQDARDTLDPDLRQRMISEAAYHLYAERGYLDGHDLEDWLAAESEVDHLLFEADDADVNAAH